MEVLNGPLKRAHTEVDGRNDPADNRRKQQKFTKFQPTEIERQLPMRTAKNRPYLVQCLVVYGYQSLLMALVSFDPLAMFRPEQKSLFIPRKLLTDEDNFREVALDCIREVGLGLDRADLLERMILVDPGKTQSERHRVYSYVVYIGAQPVFSPYGKQACTVTLPEDLWHEVRHDAVPVMQEVRKLLRDQIEYAP